MNQKTSKEFPLNVCILASKLHDLLDFFVWLILPLFCPNEYLILAGIILTST